VDLEQAAGWASDDAPLLGQIAFAYARCLPARPDRFRRWLTHAGRALAAWKDVAAARSVH
jgi:hypothetical protein